MNLDDKLRAIIQCDGMTYGEADFKVAQIKQAFAESGYVHTDAKEKADQLVIDMQNVLKKSENTLKELTSARAFVYLDKSQTMAAQVMTGQEWYERFEKELYKPKPQEYPMNHNDDGESHDRFFRAGGTNFMYNEALEAAKKASGIE